MPTHKIYTEVYGGACSVLLNKPPSEIEIYNDLNKELVNFFQVLRNNPDELLKQLFLTPYSREEFTLSSEKTDNNLESARRFYCQYRQSMAGVGKVFSTCSLGRTRRGMSDVISGWLSSIENNLPIVIERLRTVLVECLPAVDCIKKYDKEDTVHYVDPPYLHSTRVGNSQYGAYEMSNDQHKELADTLNAVSGKIILSGYRNDLYDEWYKNWSKVEFNLPNNSAKSKTKERRIEVLWLNY